MTIRDISLAYLLISDHATSYIDDVCSGDKGDPLEYLNKWLTIHTSSNVSDLYTCVDPVSELGRNIAFIALVTKHWFTLEAISPGASLKKIPQKDLILLWARLYDICYIR